MQYYMTLKAKLVYIFSINDSLHRGLVKIGDATLDEGSSVFLAPNCSELKAAARKRIDQYTKTASIPYTLHHAELTMYIHNGQAVSFNDKEVHKVLLRSGIKRHDFSIRNQGKEWFECSPETALKAIQAVKEGRSYIGASEITPITDVIEFRQEQLNAIEKTVTKFSSGGRNMLWNAKMRFGKTLSALEVVKELGYKRTIIITHRPVVDVGWFEDFGKIFTLIDGYYYGSKDYGEPFDYLEKAAKKDPDFKYIYFASIQDLRGAKDAGGKFEKNTQIFNTSFDLVIIDEGHEGTKTELGQNVINLLNKENTHVLNLSGTPFNLLDDYKEDEIFTWDYVMEQKAKAEWDLNHFGDPNPYAGLPKLNIFTFDLGKVLDGFEDVEDKAFNFTEFFRVWTGDPERDHAEMPEGMEGKFIHEEHVRSFLDLIVKYDENSNYPFSTVEFRNAFRHSLWMVPGVKEAKALSALLKDHPIFGQFIGAKGQSGIVNVAGPGDEDVPDDDALKLVRKAMGDGKDGSEGPEDTRTITLSCGKLTTGVTVPPWTAVMYLSGSHNTDAKAYMQTIFRVQSPYTTSDGKRKENCYVFDFAPDRTLHVLAETAKISHRATSTATEHERIRLGEFLNFCPVIGYNGTKMDEFNVEKMLEELKKVYISRVTKNGCDDPRLYNMEMLRKLDEEALSKFQDLHKIIGSTKANHTSNEVDMAKNGLTDEQYRQFEEIQKKKKQKRELTEEELRLLEEAKEKKKNADAAISILRGISIRFPLLMYGAELQNEGQEITLENFADLIDDQSWEEFMPRKVTKELFKEFIPYYDPDMFRAVGRNYRELVRQADALPPLERVKAIASIFDYFRNPDKETVLTPWRVVNMHIGDCLGGWDFYEDDTTTKRVRPKFNDLGAVTKTVFSNPNTRILEINSKTGLYPLYMAYSVFAQKLQAYRDKNMLSTDVPLEMQNKIWDEVLRDNIFVICKTEMAKSITKRTLRGFRQAKVNARYFEDLINKITNQPDLFISKVTNGINYWKNNTLENDMKFNAIVGNPPYQVSHSSELTKNNAAFASAIYPMFIEISRKLRANYISMITPSRWMTKIGQGIKDEWVDEMIACNHFVKIHDYLDASDCFPGVEIKGGVNYFLYSNEYDGACSFIIHNKGVVTEKNEHLGASGSGIIIRDTVASEIVSKIAEVEGDYLENYLHNFSSYVSPKHYFDRDELLSSNWRGYVKERDAEHPIKFYLNRQLEACGYGWIREKDIPKCKETLPLHKIYIPKAGGSGNDPIVLGKPIYGEPNSVCSYTYLVIGYSPERHGFNQDECYSIISYLKTRFFRYLVSIKKKTQDNPRDVFQFVPLQEWSHLWTDEELYRKYNLTKQQIEYIESLIKPMDAEVLFNSDDLLDPNFGEFNLLEHGVKVGDTIIYTPVGMELTVAEGNMVEYGGEKYTLAQFTAKYMPRNKRSVSGVCQGPKYFSYNGVSLYQMKESFLGGKKNTVE